MARTRTSLRVEINGKDCAFCSLYVADDYDHDYECLLHAYDRAKDGPGELCPGPGIYGLMPCESANAHIVAINQALEDAYAEGAKSRGEEVQKLREEIEVLKGCADTLECDISGFCREIEQLKAEIDRLRKENHG